MLTGSIQRVIATFQNAFEALGADVPAARLEALAVSIHHAMTDEVRSYHRLEHVFELLESGQPVRNLAALYHDIVYFQVDRGFSPEIRPLVSPYLFEKDGVFFLVATLAPADRNFRLLLGVFGFQLGQALPVLAGLNEFLSALVMLRKLDGLLSEADLVRIAACIEATIPFRGRDAQGCGPFERMELRLLELVDHSGLAMTLPEVTAAVRDAVAFANLDVGSFAHSDVNDFMAGTWKLLLESNQALRSRWVYTIRSYRQAIQNSEDFLSRLEPERVFHSYRGVPSASELAYKVKRARQNIAIACEYLRIKLAAMAILEALAECSGGDAPMSLFMGDLPQEGELSQRLEHFLPQQERPPWVDTTSPVFRLLESGRNDQADFDLQNSPLTLFVYQHLSPDRFAGHLALAREFFSGRLPPDQFLAVIAQELLAPIARAAAEMVSTRREELLRYA